MRRWPVLSAALLSVLVIGSSVAYRSAYGTWWQTPTRISYCNRTYLAGTANMTLAQIRERQSKTALPGDQPYPVVNIGKTPAIVGRETLAAVTPEAQRAKLGLPCTMGLYLHSGDDSYTAFGLSGGP